MVKGNAIPLSQTQTANEKQYNINSVRWFTLAYFVAEAFGVNFQNVYSIFAGITSLASCQLQTMICKEQVNLQAQ